MKHRLPILPAIAVGVLAAIGAGVIAAKMRARDAREAHKEAPPAVVLATPAAADLVRKSAEQLASHRSISAKVNLTADIFGEPLVAGGQYLQGTPESRHLRMELKVQLGAKVCSLQQISDGHAVWTRQQALHEPRLGRVDVQRALPALQEAGYRPGVDVLALGGLPMLLDSLRKSFDFCAVRNEKLGVTSTMVVTGVWKPSAVAPLLPDQKQAIESGAPPDISRLPAYIPNEVEIYIGRDDLFPHKIDFLRARAPGNHAADDRILSSMKFVELEFDRPIDPAQFTFQSGETVPVDDTDAFAARMRTR